MKNLFNLTEAETFYSALTKILFHFDNPITICVYQKRFMVTNLLSKK